MNRAQRRNEARKGKVVQSEKVLNIKASDVEAIKQTALKEAAGRAFDLMLQIPIEVLKDKHGWTPEQLDVFIDQVIDLYDSVDRDYVSLLDLQEDTQTHVKIQEKRGKL